MISKSDIRREIRSLTKAFAGDPSHSARSAEVWARAEELDGFRQAACVLLYCALPDEVSTSDFIGRWYGRKRIAVPLVQGDTLVLKEYDPARMHPGYAGIPEPDDDAVTVSPSEIDLAFIPGVAFDAAGNRLGRGKGFYDRLLPQLSCPTAGVCFRFQLVESIPADPWDMKVGTVISD